MSGRYRVVPTATFQEDIERLEEHIVQREPASHTPDETCRFRFRDAMEHAMGLLSSAPHTCGRSEAHWDFREAIVPFGHGGSVVLVVIRDVDVALLAARDQHEDDYR